MSILFVILHAVTQWASVLFEALLGSVKWLIAIYRAFSVFGEIIVGLLMLLAVFFFDALTLIWDHTWPILVQVVSGHSVAAVDFVPGPLAQGFAFMNSFMPLSEACILFLAGVQIYVAAAFVRSVKAAIPFVWH